LDGGRLSLWVDDQPAGCQDPDDRHTRDRDRFA
jgi:hypothetical protein